MQQLENTLSISNLFEPADGGFVIDAGGYPPGREPTPRVLRFKFAPPQPPAAEDLFDQQPGEITAKLTPFLPGGTLGILIPRQMGC